SGGVIAGKFHMHSFQVGGVCRMCRATAKAILFTHQSDPSQGTPARLAPAEAKEARERPRNFLGTALNPCQNFGMYVRTALLSHFKAALVRQTGPSGGEVAATKEANHAPAPPPYAPHIRGGQGGGSGQKIGWREGCLLDIFRSSGCSA